MTGIENKGGEHFNLFVAARYSRFKKKQNWDTFGANSAAVAHQNSKKQDKFYFCGFCETFDFFLCLSISMD